jgi:magnesium chelatase family protein
VIVTLAPANLRKVGAAFDLAMALDILAASGGLPFTSLEDVEVVGELPHDGGCAGFGAPSA